MTGEKCVVWALVTVATLLGACSSSQTFTTARALEARESQHTTGFELWGQFDPQPLCSERDGIAECTTPPPLLPYPAPFYASRYGLGGDIDFGLRVSASLSVAADLKVQLLGSRGFDLAVAPMLAYSYIFTTFRLPVLMSINTSRSSTLTVTPFAGYGFASDVTDPRGALVVGGALSYQFRFDRIAVIPSVEYEHRFPSTSRWFSDYPRSNFILGLGFAFGGQGAYGSGSPRPQRVAPRYRAPQYTPTQAPYVPPGYY